MVSCVNRLVYGGILLHRRRLRRVMVLPQCPSLLPIQCFHSSPNPVQGMSLAACAAQYSLTGTLISETGTATAAPLSTSPGSGATTSAPHGTSGSSTISPVVPYTPSATRVATNTTISLGTPTTSQTAQFTGAANANGVVGGLLVLGVAGVFAAL